MAVKRWIPRITMLPRVVFFFIRLVGVKKRALVWSLDCPLFPAAAPVSPEFPPAASARRSLTPLLHALASVLQHPAAFDVQVRGWRTA